MSGTPVSLSMPREGGGGRLVGLRGRIHSTQKRATLGGDRALLLISWQLGRDFLSRQAQQGCVARVQGGSAIGLLLYKSKNKVVAEYAQRDKARPSCTAKYQLVESLPAELETSLPSIEQIARELASDDASMEDNSQ